MADSQETLAQKTAAQIIDLILKEKFHPGSKLPTEKELTAAMCVSRGVVREALSILATMHIVRLVHGSGIYVESPENAVMLSSYRAFMRLGYASIDEMYEIWQCLEADAAMLAAKRITQAGIYELELCLEESGKVILGDEKKFHELDVRFHHIISEYCQNRLLMMNMRSIDEIVTHYRKVNLRYLDIRKRAYEYHRNIYDAIRNHDARLARIYMEEHLTEVKRSADFYYLFKAGEVN